MPLIWLTTICLLYYAVPGSEFSKFLNYFSVLRWLVTSLTTFSVIYFRYKAPWKDIKREFQVPIVFPIIATVMNIYIVISPIIQNPEYMYAVVFGIVMVTLLVYLPIKKGWKGYKNLLNSITLILQKTFSIAPTEKDLD